MDPTLSRLWLPWLAAALLAAGGPGDDSEPDVLRVGPFSEHPDSLPPEWTPLTFPKIPRHTLYRVVLEFRNRLPAAIFRHCEGPLWVKSSHSARITDFRGLKVCLRP